MKKSTALWGLAFLFVLTASAAHPPVSSSLRYVTGDSVITWDAPELLLSQQGAQSDGPKPQARLLHLPTKRELRRLKHRWNTSLRPQLNIVGSLGENCGTPTGQGGAEVLYTAMAMYLAEGGGGWMDVAERAISNSLYRANGWPASDEERRVARQALADAMSAIYATDEEGLYVNLFVNNTAHVVTEHFSLYVDQLTAMPDEGRVKIRLTGLGRGGRQLTLRIRIPRWVDGRDTMLPSATYQMSDTLLPQLYVNGRPEDLPVERGYWVVCRKWNSGDEVFFDFPMSPRIMRRTDGNGRPVRGAIAVARGPVVYSCVSDTSGCYFSSNAPLALSEDPRWLGRPVWTGHLYRDAGTPADASAPEVPLVLVPWREAALFENPVRGAEGRAISTPAGTSAVWLREPR